MAHAFGLRPFDWRHNDLRASKAKRPAPMPPQRDSTPRQVSYRGLDAAGRRTYLVFKSF